VLFDGSEGVLEVEVRDFAAEDNAGHAREVVVQPGPESGIDDLVTEVVEHVEVPHRVQVSGRPGGVTLASLTPREQQVLEWVAEGKTNAEIAQILVAATGTVRKHLEHIYAKLGVHTRSAAAACVRARLPAAA
jgi:DNA-binding CsgD family transcriptional regulator